MKLEKILVPVDFSGSSQRALREADELATASGARLLLVHVLQDIHFPTVELLEHYGMPDLHAQMRERAQQRLEELARQCGAAARPILREGDPAGEIADLAQQEDADLVVIAPHGRTALERFLLGSTAQRVVASAPCSVLVVRNRKHGESDSAAGARNRKD